MLTRLRREGYSSLHLILVVCLPFSISCARQAASFHSSSPDKTITDRIKLAASYFLHHRKDKGVDGTDGKAPLMNMAVLDSRLLIVHYDGDAGELRVTRALVDRPSSDRDWAGAVLTSVGSPTRSGLTILDGQAWISFYDSTDQTIHIAYAKDPGTTGARAWSHYGIDAVGPSSGVNWTCLTSIQGRLAVSYHDGTTGALKVAIATTPRPIRASDWKIAIVDGSGQVGVQADLTVHNGNLAIAYLDSDHGTIKLAQALTPFPKQSTDWRIQTLGKGSAMPTVHSYLNLLAITFRDASTLKVARTEVMSPMKASDWNIKALDGEDSNYTTASLYNGQLALLHQQDGGGTSIAIFSTSGHRYYMVQADFLSPPPGVFSLARLRRLMRRLSLRLLHGQP